jgi:hypothetical protein
MKARELNHPPLSFESEKRIEAPAMAKRLLPEGDRQAGQEL